MEVAAPPKVNKLDWPDDEVDAGAGKPPAAPLFASAPKENEGGLEVSA